MGMACMGMPGLPEVMDLPSQAGEYGACALTLQVADQFVR